MGSRIELDESKTKRDNAHKQESERMGGRENDQNERMGVRSNDEDKSKKEFKSKRRERKRANTKESVSMRCNTKE